MLNVNRSGSTAKINGRFELATYPLVTPGVYIAEIRSWKVIPLMFGAPKLMIQCDVTVEDEIVGLTYFCNVKLTEENQISPPGRRSRLSKLMRALLPSDTPERNLDDLIGIRCLARVETSDKDENRQLKPKSQQFSVIQDLQPLENEDDQVVPF